MELVEALTSLLDKTQSYVKGASAQVFARNEEAREAVEGLADLLSEFGMADLETLRIILEESR